MEKLNFKQLKALAKNQGIPKYYQMRKSELIEAMATPKPQPQPAPNRDLLDEPIPEINIPILKPSKPTRNPNIPSLKLQESRSNNEVRKEIINFSDWILSYVPEPTQKTVNERIDSLKEKVNQIYKKLNKFTPKEQETSLEGYLKTYRIDGQTGYDPKTFTTKIKQKVLDLINKQKKPIKVKFILTCKFIKENQLLVRPT